MIEFIYFKYLVEIVLREYEQNQELLEEKSEILKYFCYYANEFKKRRMKMTLIIAFFENKAKMVVKAETKAELNEIKKISIPVYDRVKGKLVSSGIFHSEEEELMLWSIFTSSCKPDQLGYERFCELFTKLHKIACE